MKTKTCDCCKTEIEMVDRFVESDREENSNYKEPCNKCDNNLSCIYEMPCNFCIHSNQEKQMPRYIKCTICNSLGSSGDVCRCEDVKLSLDSLIKVKRVPNDKDEVPK